MTGRDGQAGAVLVEASGDNDFDAACRIQSRLIGPGFGHIEGPRLAELTQNLGMLKLVQRVLCLFARGPKHFFIFIIIITVVECAQ